MDRESIVQNPAFVVAIAFVVFVALVARPLGRIIRRGLDTRSSSIGKDLAEAARLKEEAQLLLNSYQRRQKQAIDEAEEIVEHARAESQRIIANTRKTVEEELSRRTALAVQKIAQAEASAIKDIRDNAVDITVSAARTLIVENLSQEAVEVLVTKAISDIGRKFH